MASNPLDQIKGCLKNGQSFLLEAGAGSGKTWHLMEAAQYLVNEHGKELLANNQKIMCITYTNVATDEISDRVNGNPLVLALTYHKFLWQTISQFQAQLREAMTESSHGSSIPDLLKKLDGKKIEYSEYKRDFEDGVIWHDDVLELSRIMFDKYPKLSRIVASKYPFIFVDEYQDTAKEVVELLLNSILEHYQESVTIGFFGDSLQAIYGTGVGELEDDRLKRIELTGNYRCSKAVIRFLNSIRPELIQEATGQNKAGSVQFVNGGTRREQLEENLKKNGWDFDPAITKVLLLTHRAIANEAGNLDLYGVYNNRYRAKTRDMLYEKQDPYSDFLFSRVEPFIQAFETNNYGKVIEILGKQHVTITSHSDKTRITRKISGLILERSGTVGDVLGFIYTSGLFPKPPRIEDFESSLDNTEHEHYTRHLAFYDNLMLVQYSEVIDTFNYIEENTPFSTQHNTKGAEYENVLLIINDKIAKKWYQYDFEEYLSGTQCESDRHKRTRKLFYVCCSRAINNLVIFAPDRLSDAATQTLNRWLTKPRLN